MNTRPIIQLHNPNVLDAIRVALHVVKADIVVDDDGCLVATYDGHFVRLDHNCRRCDCLAWHLQFMKGDRRIDPPPKLAHEFFSLARELAWFKQEHRGHALGVRQRASKHDSNRRTRGISFVC